MILQQAFIGTRVLVHYDTASRYLKVHQHPGTILIPALVLEQSPALGATTIGWSRDQTVPVVPVVNSVRVHPIWNTNYGITAAHQYGNHCEFVPYKDDFQIGNPIAKKSLEKMCKNPTCRRLNDVGISMCWWCQIPNPTS